MSTITQQPVQGYAHCRDSLCPGNEQEPVSAIREQADLYYKEWDPNGVPGVMNSTHRFMFADPEDLACPHCGQNREVTDQVRPVYPVMTSQLDGIKTTDQRFLLELQKKGLVLAPGDQTANGGGGHDAQATISALEKQIAELTGLVNGFVAGQRTAQNPAGAADEPAEDTPTKRRTRRAQGEEPTA